jgi:hypothetical protein
VALVNIAHFQKINELGASPKEPSSDFSLLACPTRTGGGIMKKIPLATVAILAFAAPSFAKT